MVCGGRDANDLFGVLSVLSLPGCAVAFLVPVRLPPPSLTKCPRDDQRIKVASPAPFCYFQSVLVHVFLHLDAESSMFALFSVAWLA